MSTSRSSRSLRAALTFAAAGGLVLVSTGVAAAHVTAEPGTAEKGGHARIAFRVPNESATAGTVKLQVTLPADHPITGVRTTPVPGWRAQITKVPLNPPVEVHGATVTEAARTIIWTAQRGTRIGPDEFVEFPVSLGPLPEDADQLVFPAAQTYDDGTVVNWDQPQAEGAPDPEHPAPTLKLVTAAGSGDHEQAPAAPDPASAPTPAAPDPAPAPTQAQPVGTGVDNTARWLGGVGLVLGALGLAGAVLRGRRGRMWR